VLDRSGPVNHIINIILSGNYPSIFVDSSVVQCYAPIGDWGTKQFPESKIVKGEGTSMKKGLVFLSLLALAIALPATAQMQPKSVARVLNIKIKPGTAPQFEEGWKKFHQWEQQQNVPLTFHTWTIVSGPRTGQYVTGTFGHDWKDFDARTKFLPAIWEHIWADVGPYVESTVMSYWVYREDLSGPPPNAGQTPPAFSEVTTFFLKIGGGPAVTDAIKAVGAAIEKSHWQGKPSGWYSLVNGGYGGALALSTGHENWADFQPPEPDLFKMINDVYGQEGAAALFKKFNSGVRNVRTEIWRYRPDLSYIPASQ
jgi:hypothetical protein